MKLKTHSFRLTRNLICLAIGLGVGLLVFVLHLVEGYSNFDLLRNVEVKTVDLRFRLRGPRVPGGQVAIAAIDSKSVEALGRWPWTRSVHARLIDRLREWGATAIAFDVLFTEEEGAVEAERLRKIAAVLPDSAEAAKGIVDGAMNDVLADRSLKASLERSLDENRGLTVLSFDFVFRSDIAHTGRLGKLLSSGDEQSVFDLATYASRNENVAFLRKEPAKLALGIRPVIPSLAQSCAALGYANPVFDPDGTLRREQVFVVYSPAVRDAFEKKADMEAALLDQKTWVQAFMPLSVAGVATHLGLTVDQLTLDLEKGELRFPVPDGKGGKVERAHRFDPFDGTARIDFYGPSNTIPTWSISDIVEGKLVDQEGHPIPHPENHFKGRLVFVGMSDPGLADFFSTPFTARLPGVEKHAMFAENLLEGRQLRTHDDYDRVVGLTALGAGLIVALVAANFSAAFSGIILLFIGAVWHYLTFRHFTESGMVWNWTAPALSAMVGFAAVTLYRQLTEEREKRRVRSAFSHYMSPAAVTEVLSNPEGLKLGGERRSCSIFFSDVVGFTTLSESIADPADLVRLMNRYLGRMTDLILKQDGILDKYIGDAIMAIFGAPVVRADHAARACAAALSNMEDLQKLRAELKAEGLPDIDCRIGINTGEVVIGNMGSSMRMDYTVLGDTVNLASRLEGANKPYHTHIMVGPRTRKEASEHDPTLVFRRLDLLTVKGKIEPVEVFELVGRTSTVGERTNLIVQLYEKGIDFYRARKFEDAKGTFRAVLEIDPEDGPSLLYVERCEAFLVEPPPEDWDGVFHLKTK
jgi:adenylate cyclase